MVLRQGTNSDYICDSCLARKRGERWWCAVCQNNLCFECKPGIGEDAQALPLAPDAAGLSDDAVARALHVELNGEDAPLWEEDEGVLSQTPLPVVTECPPALLLALVCASPCLVLAAFRLLFLCAQFTMEDRGGIPRDAESHHSLLAAEDGPGLPVTSRLHSIQEEETEAEGRGEEALDGQPQI